MQLISVIKNILRRKRWPLLAVALIVALGVFMALRIFTAPVPRVVSEAITRGDIEKTVLATGVLEPSVQVNVGAQVNGQLTRLYVKQGDRVEKGQLLAEIDPTLQENELQTAKAQLDNSRAQERSHRVTLHQYFLELQRQTQMDTRGAAVKSEYEKARAQYDMMQEQLRMDRAQITQAEIAVKTASANLGYTRILAPVSGEVLGIVTREGQTIVSSQVAPTLLVLANTDVMRVRTRISETDILRVAPGQPLWFYVLANTNERYHSVLGEIQSAPDEALQDQSAAGSGSGQPRSAIYYNGVFEVDNPDHRLKTSMTAQVFIVTSQAKNALRIPIAALGVSLGKDRYQVQVQRGNVLESRIIRTGINDRQFAEVKEGLAKGERVVVLGGHAEQGGAS